jgi:hypothetical protein
MVGEKDAMSRNPQHLGAPLNLVNAPSMALPGA